MKLFVSIFVVFLFSVNLLAQKTNPPQKVSNGTKAAAAKRDLDRFEIVSVSNCIVKLDTFTGLTYIYITGNTIDSLGKWVADSASNLPNDDRIDRPKYRIYRHSKVIRGASYSYLMDTDTGRSWVSKDFGFEGCSLRWKEVP